MTTPPIAASLPFALSLALALGACSTLSGRDRIVRAPQTCEDVTVPIYFEPNVAEVSAEGRRVLAEEAARAGRCRVDGVLVLGLADATGSSEVNLELSRRRAASVAEAIRRAGLPEAEFDIAAAGEAGALTQDGARQPVRRRADVTLRLTAAK